MAPTESTVSGSAIVASGNCGDEVLGVKFGVEITLRSKEVVVSIVFGLREYITIKAQLRLLLVIYCFYEAVWEELTKFTCG